MITADGLPLQPAGLAVGPVLLGVKFAAGIIVEPIASAVGREGATPTIRELLGNTQVAMSAMFPGGKSKTDGTAPVTPL